MNKNYTYDFSTGSIKHQIEEEFYKLVGESLSNVTKSSTIVTGPDYQRHVDNFHKYISTGKLRICEINEDIFVEIYQGCKQYKNVSVKNISIENYGSFFIDCDLTAISDIPVIENTLIKQIITLKGSSEKNKAFIFTFSLRSGGFTKREYVSRIRGIFGLLGNHLGGVSTIKDKLPYKDLTYLKEVRFCMNKGRIQSYKAYTYNAGGDPMFTCLLIYK